MLFRVNMFDNKRGVKKEEDQISRRISIVPHVNSYLKKANSRSFKKIIWQRLNEEFISILFT